MTDLTNDEFRAKVLAKVDALRAMLSPEEDEWLSPTAARRLTGVYQKKLAQWAKEGILTTRQTPWGTRLYSKRQLTEVVKAWEDDG